MWVLGGGRDAPNPSNQVDIYTPATNSWSVGLPFTTARRNFPADIDPATGRVYLVGGYAPSTATNSMQIFVPAVPCGTATVTPTGGTPTNTPGGPTPTATCPAQAGYDVLIVYADTNPPTQLQTAIQAEPGVTSVDLFDARVNTPTLAQLLPYELVVTFSNSPYGNNTLLGDNLASYYDGGGVVVQMGFSFYSSGTYGVGGRWLSDGYSPYNYSTTLVLNVPFTLGTYNAGHPLMAGVTALGSNFQNVVTLATGATQVAAASNGNSLIAVRPVGSSNTVGITAYIGATATWSGDFARVIVNAARWLRPQGCVTPTVTSTAQATATNTAPAATATATCPAPGGGYDILIVYADGATPPATLRTQLLAEPDVTSVDYFNGQTNTPTLAELLPYDLVVAFSNFGWSDQNQLGDNLAAYIEQQNIVVAFNFSWYGGTQSIRGRWITDNFTPYNDPGTTLFSNGSLGTYDPGHPLMQGITQLNAFYRMTLTPSTGATAVANWSDGPALVTFKGRAIGVSAYVGDYAGMWSGQYGRLVVNAARWLSPQGCVTPTVTHTPPPPTATNTPVPPATSTNTPVPPATSTDTPVPGATATDTPVPPATATNTPGGPTATATSQPQWLLYLPAIFLNADSP
jgi:hypothetical protein